MGFSMVSATVHRLRPEALALVALLGLAGCTSLPPVPPVPPVPPAAALEEIYEEYFEAQLALHPTLATYLGDPRHDDRFEDTASAAFEAEALAVERRFLERARATEPSALQDSARISLDLFVREREQAIARARFPERLLPIDQMNNPAITFALLGSGAGPQPFGTAADYDRFLRRAEGFVGWVDSAIGAMREGMARGVVQPEVVVRKSLPQLRAMIVEDPEASLFWRPVAALPDAVSAADRARIHAAWRAAIAGRIVPAYRRLADFLETEYLPAARASVGWSALPDGAAWYASRVRASTTTALTPDEIHAIGLAEVARILDEMDTVRRRVGFEGDLQAFFRHVQRDPKFFFDRPEDLLEGYRELKRRIDARLPALFADFPKADYEVRAVEPFRAASAPGASYQAPSADGRRPGIFYVNTHDLKAQPKYGMETLSLHEAAPGHHFQVAIQQELLDLPRFRRFNDYTVYAEGWALYAESLGPELGLFTDPMQWYGRLNDEMLRAMRLVVDTGLHAKGWSRQQAIDYMRSNSSLAESDVVAEVERYIAWPAQALSYKIGQLRITALRARAQERLGARFDLRAFHSQVLRDGALPMDVLEAKIDRWIEASR
jgi:uncharacterized protein (DUF885 family)